MNKVKKHTPKPTKQSSAPPAAAAQRAQQVRAGAAAPPTRFAPPRAAGGGGAWWGGRLPSDHPAWRAAPPSGDWRPLGAVHSLRAREGENTMMSSLASFWKFHILNWWRLRTHDLQEHIAATGGNHTGLVSHYLIIRTWNFYKTTWSIHVLMWKMLKDNLVVLHFTL